MRFRKGRSEPGYGRAWKSRIAGQICRAAEKMGWDVSIDEARTGTLYVECSRDLDTGYFATAVDGSKFWWADTKEIKIRVADHAECYCSEDISVDPRGSTWRNAVRFLQEVSLPAEFLPSKTVRG